MRKNSALNDEELIKKYSKTVYQVAYSVLHNRSDADDVFQNVFMTYIKKRPRFHDETHEKAWFIRVTINEAKSYVRQAWYRHSAELVEEAEETPEINESHDLDFALQQLAPRERTIIFLFYYEGYHTEEIARLLKMSVGAVRTSLSRSRKKLKTILEEEGYYA